MLDILLHCNSISGIDKSEKSEETLAAPPPPPGAQVPRGSNWPALPAGNALQSISVMPYVRMSE